MSSSGTVVLRSRHVVNLKKKKKLNKKKSSGCWGYGEIEYCRAFVLFEDNRQIKATCGSVITCGPRQRGMPALFLPLTIYVCHISCASTCCFCSSVGNHIRVKSKLVGES